MQKEELLNLLDPEARSAFDRARALARARGGVLSPLHILAAALESAAPGMARPELRQAVEAELLSQYPAGSDSILVPRDTQEIIRQAVGLARAEGVDAAAGRHLLQAAAMSGMVKTALGGTVDLQSLVPRLPEGAPGENDLARNAAPPAEPHLPPARSEPSRYDSGSITAELPPTRELKGALVDFCADLIEESRNSSFHPFVGREREITAVLETLCRKLKNNPVLIGKPGVGKTALVSAVAARLCQGQVPLRLRGKRILEVSRLRLLADAKYAGDVEERLKRLLEEVRNAGDVILFFDEIHTLLSAGGASGTGDIANLLKTSLSKGEITCIGATTLAEYYKHIARDEALARRFSTITIEEPSIEETRRILGGARSAFESYHGVRIEDDVIAIIVDLADRYLHSRSFPDKAFDLLDRAAAKEALAGSESLTRESVTETLSETTGLPLDLMDEDPAQRLERLEDFLNQAVPGQPRAVRDVARVARIAKLKLELRPEQPDGIFLFVGPEGVGKHEMASALARFLYGSAQKMIEFDMSQFTEPHSVSRLIGAEPGYVGYGDRSGLLSKAAEDNPHSALYFRNIDLAHSVVQQFLAETFEQGRFTDATGSKISLSNTTVVMSLSQVNESNRNVQVGFAPVEDSERRRTGSITTGSLGRERRQFFGMTESLFATVDEVVEFQVLDRDATERIIRERLETLAARLEAAQPVRIILDGQLAGFFADQLNAEQKSLGQLERLWQETIVIPFSHLRVEHRSTATRPEVVIRVEGGAVQLDLRNSGGKVSSGS